MGHLVMAGLLCGYLKKEKFDDQRNKKKDKDGNQMYDRKLSILDDDSEDEPAIFRVNVPEEFEDRVKALKNKPVSIVATVHQFNKYIFYRLSEITEAGSKK